MWNNEWKKGEEYPAWGNTDVYKKGDIYSTEKRLEKHTKESLKQLLVDFINQKWLKRSLITFGMVGSAWLALYCLTQEPIGASLLAALVLTSRIQFKT